jgi:hypothetical protein
VTASWLRIVGVFLSPRKVFTGIAEQPTVLVALLLASLLGTGVTHLAYGKIPVQELARVVEAKAGSLPPGTDLDAIHRFSHLAATTSVALTIPLVSLIVAGIFLGGVNLAGGRIDYRRALSVTVHGMLPLSLSTLLSLPVILTRRTIGLEEFQGGAILLSHLGAFAPEDAGPALSALLGSVDLFSIWCIALLVLGFGIVGGLSRRRAGVVVGVIWGAGVLIKLGLAALR